MHLEKQFDVRRPRGEAAEVASRDDTLTGLFPEQRTELVEATGTRKTTRTHYSALGQEGTATFHFDMQDNGDIEFEKVCDGRVWKQLEGKVSFRQRPDGTRVRIEMDGRTRSLVPEFTIKGAMHDQIEQMARALRERLEES